MFENLKTVAIRKVGMLSHTAAENAPQLYLTAGIVSGVAAAVMAAKAHNQSDGVFEDVVEQMDLVNEFIDEQKGSGFVTPYRISDERYGGHFAMTFATDAEKKAPLLDLSFEGYFKTIQKRKPILLQPERREWDSRSPMLR